MHAKNGPLQPFFHLFIVLTDPEPGSGKLVAVMVQTKEKYTDDTVVLQVGDHPFVKHPTAVQFATASYYFDGKIARALENGTCHQRASLSDEVLNRVRRGLLDSPFTVNDVRAYCRIKF